MLLLAGTLQKCAQCAAHKTPSPKPRAALVPVFASAPLELVTIDILGPLPQSIRKFWYYFMKWMEAYPIPNQEATTVSKKLMDKCFCRFSLRQRLYSDQGTQFESEIIKQACKLLQIIDKSRTTPYHSQSDGLIKRFNHTLLQILATCAETHPFQWEDHIHKVCVAYNTSVQASTGYSPFFLMFGRQMSYVIHPLMYQLCLLLSKTYNTL